MGLNKFTVNIDWLKIIALVLMTADHIVKIFSDVPCESFIQAIGRISFPIFGFILMYHLQKNQIYKKYLLRLGIFSFLTFLAMMFLQKIGFDVSAIPLNVLYMFFVCVLVLVLKKNVESKIKNTFVKSLAVCAIYILGLGLVYKLSVLVFVYMILIYHFFEKSNKANIIALLIMAYLINLGGLYGFISMIVTALLMMIDYGVKNKRLIRKWYVFYAYYPLHLIVLIMLRMYM